MRALARARCCAMGCCLGEHLFELRGREVGGAHPRPVNRIAKVAAELGLALKEELGRFAPTPRQATSTIEGASCSSFSANS
jgi:hypothetical protein